MASVNGKRTEGSIKELIDSQNPNPFGIVETCRFDLPPGEGAPQGLRGWGVRLRGSGEEFPSGFGQSPRFFAMQRMARRSRKASQSTWNFACKV